MRTSQTAYEAWAGGAAFGDDNNGMAILLGASNPTVSAVDKLPTVTETAGSLIMNFNCLPVAERGTATLKVAHSTTLGSWTTTADVVPDADNAVPVQYSCIPFKPSAYLSSSGNGLPVFSKVFFITRRAA